ncbi:Type cbb3 cytochrome oxidase biogenesis protein CcoI; Copper-translocating P-type ATPase [hydrothermal vent metagenome]|uniref:Type cbb3 cytochrome oxidase biogenesis protein CcoI Copper-translocating P-type ATPase n=1 Tax=hydrothermal vent metagenome TaxID=652676 RepID=A0A3B1AU90_9ZZZZ
MVNEIKACFHCGLDCSATQVYLVKIKDEERDMCCLGCAAVAQAIVDNGLVDYYKYRTEPSGKADNLVPEELAQLELYNNNKLQKQFVQSSSSHPEVKSASLILEGIVCAACVWLNEQHVNQLKGVKSFSINYSTQRARISWDESLIQLSDILKAIADIGYRAHPFDAGRQEDIQKKERQRALIRLAVAGLGAMQVMMLAIALYAGDYSGISADLKLFFRWVSALIAAPVVLYSAQTFFKGAWSDFKRKRLGMDVPVALAISGAYAASLWATATNSGEVYFDSVTMFTFFLLVGRFLELRARQRSGEVADALIKLLPVMAARFEGDNVEQVLVNELKVGDRLRVKPGETIPADAIIIEGQSSIDESLVTGESHPLRRIEKDNVIGGTVNIESPIILQVTHIGDDSVLAGIQRLLDRAQTEKPHIALIADKVASVFVAVILVLALGVGFVWWEIDSTRAFWIVLSMLVVTCPCALSLATPAAMTAATGALTRLGVLITRAHALETLAKVDTFVFDKTGTMTQGQLALQQTTLLGSLSKDDCQQLALSLEQASEHPVAIAFQHLPFELLVCNNVTAEVGQGLEAVINQRCYRIGKRDWVAELAGAEEKSRHDNNPSERQGNEIKSQVYLASENEWLAIFTLEDKLREDAAAMVSQLSQLNIESILLSGDQTNVVDTTAAALNIKTHYAEQSPDDKLNAIKNLQQQGHIVAMVGDGVNDAPVLAAAQVSVAMGSGTQLAQASSDMVLLSENLNHLQQSVVHARKTIAIVKQNLGWAILYNLTALPLAALGYIAPWLAAIGMSASSLIVVLNALRLMKVQSNESS